MDDKPIFCTKHYYYYYFNRYHLQALRHLYVLAAEPRIILPRDIDTGQYCYATIHLTFENDKETDGQEISLQAPCLLPQLRSLKKIELKDSRYWKITFVKHHNWQQLENMLERHDFLSIKQRAGCLSYLEDPHVKRYFKKIYARLHVFYLDIFFGKSLMSFISFHIGF